MAIYANSLVKGGPAAGNALNKETLKFGHSSLPDIKRIPISLRGI